MTKLEKLKKLRSEVTDPQMQAAMDVKIAKLEAEMSTPTEAEVVQEDVVVEKPAKKPRKPRAPKAEKAAPAAKESRHVFEKKAEGGKEVKVVKATSPAQAKEAMKGSGFEYVREIKRGRAPKEGFIADAKPKRPRAKAKPARASKASREAMAKSSGTSAEKAEKVSKAVGQAKKRGRKPLDKNAYLFEKPLKTQMGKKKVKIVKAVSEEAARKAAGSSFEYVRELKEGEKPKTGVQPIEGFMPTTKKARTEKAPRTKKARVPDEKVEEKAEAIGEGIGIANQDVARDIMSLVNDELLAIEEKASNLQMEASNLDIEIQRLRDKLVSLVKSMD